MHEKDVIATLVAFNSSCSFVEGCYVIPGQNVNTLGIVFPHGSIHELGDPSVNGTEKVVAIVEVKCPYPSEKSMPVHYTLSEYYVCQCLAEMYVLDTHMLIYISYFEPRCTVLTVLFSDDLGRRNGRYTEAI